MITLVLVPGAWHSPDAYNDILPLLDGFETAPVELPSVQKEGDTIERNMHDDVAAIRDVVQTALDRGNDVVLVAHSYGGVPAGDSVQGLTLQDRKKEGSSNGVIGIVYIAAFALPVGQMQWNKEQLPDGQPWFRFSADGKTVTTETPEKYFYSEGTLRPGNAGQMTPEEAAPYVQKLRPHWVASWLQPVSFAAYEHVPAAYLLCSEDRAVPLGLQKMIVGFKSKGYELTKEIATDHSPFLGAKKEECASFIKEAVAKFESIAAK